MQELNDLKQELVTLTTEREALELRYAELQELEANAPKNWNHLAMPVGSPEFYAAQRQRMDAGLEIDQKESRMKYINRRIQYLEQLATVDENIATAKEAELHARQAVERLQSSAHRIATKLGKMRDENREAFELASQAEKEAAQDIAKAAASDEPGADKAAQTKMAKAVEGMRKVKADRQANQPLLRAFENEAATISDQLEAAMAQERAAVSTSKKAMVTKLGVEWDQAVTALVAIGVELIKHDAGYELRDLKVPTYAPGNATFTRYELSDMAKGKAA